MKIKLSKATKIIILISFLLSMIPVPSESIPEWKILAIDRNNDPLPNIELIEEWRFNSALPKSKEVRITDENGEVVFPSRTFNCPIILRIAFYVNDFFNFIILGMPRGGYATVGSEATEYWISYVDGNAKENKLTITRISRNENAK